MIMLRTLEIENITPNAPTHFGLLSRVAIFNPFMENTKPKIQKHNPTVTMRKINAYSPLSLPWHAVYITSQINNSTTREKLKPSHATTGDDFFSVD